MAYEVKTPGNCIDCGNQTYRKRSRLVGYLCFDCGIKRQVENVMLQANPDEDMQKKMDLAFLDWVTRGGIEKANGGLNWSLSMKHRAQRLAELHNYPLPSKYRETFPLANL